MDRRCFVYDEQTEESLWSVLRLCGLGSADVTCLPEFRGDMANHKVT